MLFGQTLDYRQQLAAQLGLTDVRDLRPRFEDLAISDPDADLWKTDTDACCHIRKVIPLDAALERLRRPGSPAASASTAASGCACRWSRRPTAS